MSNEIKIDPFGFREYDARWLYKKDINLLGIENLGKGLGTQIIKNLKKENPRVVVGHDYRSYSEEIKSALKKGLISTGCYVEDIGLSLSPTGGGTLSTIAFKIFSTPIPVLALA